MQMTHVIKPHKEGIDTSTMFLNQFTQIDHAFIDFRGHVVGGSYNLSCYVGGEIDGEEQVVIDFSACKKQIKAIVDDNTYGVDHKLWITNHSLITSARIVTNGKDELWEIITPSVSICCAKDAVVDMRTMNYEEQGIPIYSLEQCEQLIKLDASKYIVDLVEKHLIQKVTIEVHLDTEFFISELLCDKSPTLEFACMRYVHGLKNSSSYGCKNIAHGHLSYAILKDDLALSVEEHEDFERALVDNPWFSFGQDPEFSCVFIKEENVVEDNEVFIQLAYLSERGHMSMTIKKQVECPQPYKVFEQETTIENLANSQLFKDLHIVAASEGLAKGAVLVP